jgi:hypothetical protein
MTESFGSAALTISDQMMQADANDRTAPANIRKYGVT